MLAAIAEGGALFESVVFTRNRRTMASASRRGGVRLHEAFRHAPREVLVAVGRFFGSRRRAARAAAAIAIRDFVRASVADPAPAERRPAPAPKADIPHLERLRLEFREVNDRFFEGSLPEVPIRLSGRMRRRNGHFSAHPLEIAISRALCFHADAGEAERTLRHEMIHLWQWATGSPLGHGPDFRRWARTLEIHPRATRAVLSLSRPHRGS